MRLRTGHGPNDWSDNIPGCHAAVTGHGGTLVQGDPGAVARERAREERERRAKGHVPRGTPKPVDLNDYHRPKERPRCGKMMPVAGEPCARRPGHRDTCKTLASMEYNRLSRRRVA